MNWKYLNPLLWIVEFIGIIGIIFTTIGLSLIFLREKFFNM